MNHITRNEDETTQIAQKLAQSMRPELGNRPYTIFLTGALGSGKSVFARALIRDLMDDHVLNVPSPTFTLVQSYDTPDGFPIHHLDLYRLDDPEEVLELGWDDLQAEGLCIVEWPEKLGAFKSRKPIEININTEDRDGPRHININNWEEETLGL